MNKKVKRHGRNLGKNKAQDDSWQRDHLIMWFYNNRQNEERKTSSSSSFSLLSKKKRKCLILFFLFRAELLVEIIQLYT